MRNIVLVMSDQHSGVYTSIFDNKSAITKNLRDMAYRGQVFANAYSNCPLCVPSRMSFLSGISPDKLNIYDNDTVIDSDVNTIATAMNQKGYRTILCGRMHFKGEDQYHGFSERYVGDITTQWWGEKREDLGFFDGTMNVNGCLNEYGFGNSPVLAFDEAVVDKAIELIATNSSEPIFMVIGLYGPHFPYCSNVREFDKYYDYMELEDDRIMEVLSEYVSMQQNCDLETLRHIRSAYFGMIETIDKHVGRIKEKCFEKIDNPVFIYTSDHGDQIGKRSLFGKKTLYEESIKVPIIIEDRCLEQKTYSKEISLLDLSKTILDYGEASLEGHQGENVYEKNSPVLISSMIESHSEQIFTQCSIFNRKKLIEIKDKRYYIDLSEDVLEERYYPYEGVKADKQLENTLINNEEKELIKKKYQEQLTDTVYKKEWTKIHKPIDTIRYKLKKSDIERPRRRRI